MKAYYAKGTHYWEAYYANATHQLSLTSGWNTCYFYSSEQKFTDNPTALWGNTIIYGVKQKCVVCGQMCTKLQSLPHR